MNYSHWQIIIFMKNIGGQDHIFMCCWCLKSALLVFSLLTIYPDWIDVLSKWKEICSFIIKEGNTLMISSSGTMSLDKRTGYFVSPGIKEEKLWGIELLYTLPFRKDNFLKNTISHLAKRLAVVSVHHTKTINQFYLMYVCGHFLK